MKTKTFFLFVMIGAAICFIIGGLACATYLKAWKKADDLTKIYEQKQSEIESQLTEEEWETIWGECDKMLYDAEQVEEQTKERVDEIEKIKNEK